MALPLFVLFFFLIFKKIMIVLDIFLRDIHNQINVLRSTEPRSLTTVVLRWVKPQSIMTNYAWQYERQQNLIIYSIKINFLSTYNNLFKYELLLKLVQKPISTISTVQVRFSHRWYRHSSEPTHTFFFPSDSFFSFFFSLTPFSFLIFS